MPGKAGRLDGKGGGWRDIMRRSRLTVASLVEITRRVLCNKSTRLQDPAFFVLYLCQGSLSLYAHPGNSVESLDSRE